MKNVTIQAVFMTLPALFDCLKSGVIASGTHHILIRTKEEASSLEDTIGIRSHISDVNVGDSFLIKGNYRYGFDVEAGESDFELDMEDINDHDATVKFMVVNFGEQEFSDSPAPIVEKVEAIKVIDVTTISSDDLLKVVNTYDDIHAAAIKELNTRLIPVADKLGIGVSQ